MRLTCPRCRAEYEIPDTAIPAAGREVECSSCNHVWLQMPAAAPQTRANPVLAAQPAVQPDAAPPPETAAPLSRPLDDSVLSILREEAARELSARQAEGRAPAPRADHIPVTIPPAAPPPQDPRVQPAPQPVPRGDLDWPVATVTLPDDSLPPAPRPRPAAPQPTLRPEPPAAAPPAAVAPAADAPAPLPAPLPEPVASITDPEPDLDPAPAPESPRRRLPDAALLAASLTRPALSTDTPVAAAPATSGPSGSGPLTRPAQPAQPVPPSRPAALPALVPARRGRYAAGFVLAVTLALAFLALYALPPSSAEEGPGGWRQGVDQARIWLHAMLPGG